MIRETPIPHIPCSDTFNALEAKLLDQTEKVEKWFELAWQKAAPPVYGSVDLRNAGFKLAPIDMNLFPAGFNNLNTNFLSLSIDAAKKIIEQVNRGTQRILVIPESHTRNLRYFDNIKTLENILVEAGFEVRFATLDDAVTTPLSIALADDQTLVIAPLKREGDILQVDNFIPDVILLNNDLSEGIPDKLKSIKQPLLPPAALGWSQRLKSQHFQAYAAITTEFAQAFDFDPWLITPLSRHCSKVDFMQKEGLECVIHHAETLFLEIKQKYAEYHITEKPFVIVKADAGTYGMAVMTVRDLDELKNMNRKQRTKMASTKGNRSVDRVIIQEGVYTFETITRGVDKAVAEPVIYLWGDQVVGGFYRVHQSRGIDENLNSPGMEFEPLAFKQACHKPCEHRDLDHLQNRYYVYGIVAKLSMLAAAHEIRDLI